MERRIAHSIDFFYHTKLVLVQFAVFFFAVPRRIRTGNGSFVVGRPRLIKYEEYRPEMSIGRKLFTRCVWPEYQLLSLHGGRLQPLLLQRVDSNKDPDGSISSAVGLTQRDGLDHLDSAILSKGRRRQRRLCWVPLLLLLSLTAESLLAKKHREEREKNSREEGKSQPVGSAAGVRMR